MPDDTDLPASRHDHSKWAMFMRAAEGWGSTVRFCLILLAAGAPATAGVIWLATRP